ncbi:MAG: hypothetical protein HYU79_06050 [Nitrosomonadales bacterium]|nr:hypothetical protein [Nitrosomonadales bacterium]
MSLSDYLSSAALFVSVVSLGVSIFYSQKDQMRLKAESKYFSGHPDYDRPHLNIRVINHGRRIAILRLFGGNTADGGWQGTVIGDQKRGLYLNEHEFYETKFYIEDIEATSPDSESEFVELWFEDSLGRRHKVKNSKKHIQHLKKECGRAE